MSKHRGRNRRAARREERQTRRADRRTSRNERRMDRRGQRMDARQMRTETRQGGRSDRSALRTEARMTAYEQGIDPNAWVGDSIQGVASAASDVMSAKAMAGAMAAGNEQPAGVKGLLETLNKSEGPDTGEKPGEDLTKMALPIGLGLLALKMLRK